jgi:hypothetical protein
VHVTAAAADSKVLSVPASRLQEFDPAELGVLRPRYRRLLGKIDGQPQSVIRRILIQEAEDITARSGGIDQLAYRASLLVLRDYVASGYYPIVSGGRCFLAPIFESEALDPARRRAALTHLYRTARDRALIEREQTAWIRRLADALPASAYAPERVLATLRDGSPVISLERASTTNDALDARGLWRAVRATWSMGPEVSAPGREVAFVAFDQRVAGTPLGILQLRNVVPEIAPRDLWMATSVGDASGSPRGYLGELRRAKPRERKDLLRATQRVLENLLTHVEVEGLPFEDPTHAAPTALTDFARARREHFKELRRAGDNAAHNQLALIKRAETISDLSRGISAINTLIAQEDPLGPDPTGVTTLRDLDAGLRKIWHYHMGFVAIELSICGAAPPFGAIRAGKLMAGLAGSSEAMSAWGVDRPLGEIASTVYRADVREAIPNPGPLVIFTSGLFPGHSAQYNRSTSGVSQWKKIGETTGFGSFHIALDTARALTSYNDAVDGYAHITRKFGEGSGPRFRAVGRGLARLGVPDLRRHEVRRPLYALPLVDDPRSVLLGWATPAAAVRPSAQEVAEAWWCRWFEPSKSDLLKKASEASDLVVELDRLAALDGA